MSALRKVDIGNTAILPPDEVRAGAVPELRWVEIDDLRIDDSYQRPLAAANWTAIRKIAAQFSWSMFAPIVAAPIVGGQYALIDGQHRTHAAKICGFDRVPAMIVMTAEVGQAAAFAAINGNVVRMSAFHVYKAALAARVDWAVAAEAAVSAAGCRLMTYNPGSGIKPGDIASVNEVRRYIEGGYGHLVTLALEALRQMEHQRTDLYAASVLVPWFSVLRELGAAARDADLVAFCARQDLAKLQGQCLALSQTDDYRGRRPAEIFRTALMAIARKELCTNAPVPQLSGEAAMGARMAEVAAKERKAMRAVT
ncbi:ParB-like nuclease family protein [Defluviimonas denitrificans]|jgi:hypothetical protein|uniref:ParB-like nuclease family protein n=1 Tax=Albidovulum denitrificans TaxID=404881 RepID=A0A2S8RWE0_9RHOB|nr:ParB N-terminal domain-containing protein [Defluviimonas denitrificans]PQV52876.1 ParB-like nuclease family protein [Defluviimonas denitrificans]